MAGEQLGETQKQKYGVRYIRLATCTSQTMESLNFTSFQHDASYFYETTCKDGLSRNSTAATETNSTTVDGSSASSTSKRSYRASSSSLTNGGIDASWESRAVEFIAENSSADCSKLSSDHGSSRNIGPNDDSLNLSKQNQSVPVVPNDDSFYVTYESGLLWIEDDLSELDGGLPYTNTTTTPLKHDETELTRRSNRGRSMSKENHSTRGKSVDSNYKQTMTTASSSSQKTMERSSRRSDSRSDIRTGNNHNAAQVQEFTTTRNEQCTSIKSNRRGTSIPRRQSFSTINVQQEPSRFARSKRKNDTSSRRSKTAANESNHSSITTKSVPSSALTNDPVSQRPSACRRHSSSMVSSELRPMNGTKSNFSTERTNRRSAPSNKTSRPGNVTHSSAQKVMHPLTAKLLADLIMTGQATVQIRNVESQDDHCQELMRLQNDAIVQGRKSVVDSRKKAVRNEFDSSRTRRLEKQMSFPESPTRTTKVVSHHKVDNSYNLPSTGTSGSKPHIRTRPKMETNLSFPGSPARIRKPSSRTIDDNNIEELCQRFNSELQQPSTIAKSSSGRPKNNDHHHHNGQPNTSQSEKARHLSDHTNANQRKDTRHNKQLSSRDKSEEVNVAISNYFTPRNPTPHRNADYRHNNNNNNMSEGTPDDSAFWNIDPHAFDPTTTIAGTTTATVPKRSSFRNERFL